MFKLTKKIEYALIAISYINKKDKNKLSSSKEISLACNIPRELLAKIMQSLTKVGYLNAIKGAKGGYFINQSLDEIRLIDFIENIEGPFGLVNCQVDQHCDIINNCEIKTPIFKINENIKTIFKETSLLDITR
tara:strand:+ start:838 stop:1236 length:399 start_codon:yes stop_codon:yes gene_type:complete